MLSRSTSSNSKQACVQNVKKCLLLYWPSERTNPMTSHAVILQDGGALAPKAVTKQPFFFKMVTIIIFVIYIFFIKMKVIFQNNVNLTDCFHFKVTMLLGNTAQVFLELMFCTSYFCCDVQPVHNAATSQCSCSK